MTKFTASLIALAVSSAFAAQAADNRYIIHVDSNNKSGISALAEQLGGKINLDANGFISATFEDKDLATVETLMSNPTNSLTSRGIMNASTTMTNAVFTSIETDERRYPLLESGYSDGAGDPRLQQVTPYSIKQSQADQVSFNANAGIKVCVIDSGLDATNLDFVWANITGDNDLGTGNWNENGGPHGTHVAGTIGAADNNIGVVGMAPGVEMHIIKVFNDSGWGYSSDLAYAAQKCTNAGANIISMSLGGGGANATEENAFDAFTAAGGLVVAAAGNDGNTTRSYPAGYESVMMIGGNSKDNGRYEASQFPSCSSTKDNCVEVTAGGLDVLSTYPEDMAIVTEMSVGEGEEKQFYASAALENFGKVTGPVYYMGTAETTDSGANGNICVIDRGNISFHDKVQNCENSGGIGAIIVNNVAGLLSSATLGDTNATTIPAVGAALEDKSAFLEATTATIDMSRSSYGYMSGTSMATPGVAGVAALVWSNYSECSGTDIREVLKATAADLGAAGHDVYYGHGVVQAKDAFDHLATNGCSGVVIPPVTGTELMNGVAQTSLTAVKGDALTFTFEVPAGASNLTFNSSGRMGNADLYINFAAAASSSNNVCKSEKNRSTESCSISNVQEGTYHVTLSAYRYFRNVSLVASYTEASTGTDSYSNNTAFAISDHSTKQFN